MINRDELVPIGQFKKPHGIKGEIAFFFTDDSFIADECPYLICEMDGIFVPFRIEYYRFISNSTAYIQLQNVDSDQKARMLSHKEVFYPKKYMKEIIENDSDNWNVFFGYTLIDQRIGKVGRIIDVDQTTMNTLFIVEKEEEEILIPAVEEFIIQINEEREELWMTLPEGLME